MLTSKSSDTYRDGVTSGCDIAGMTGLAERIRETREMRGISQAEVADACGVSRAAVAQWESRTKPKAPTLDKVEPLTERLDVDPYWLLRGRHAPTTAKTAGATHTTVRVPESDIRRSTVGRFEIRENSKRDVWLFSRRYLAEDLRIVGNQLIIWEVLGDSMAPTLSSGDRVLVNLSEQKVGQPGLFLVWDGDGATVKRLELIPNTKPPQYRTALDNPAYGTYEVPVADTRIIGRVVWFARRL